MKKAVRLFVSMLGALLVGLPMAAQAGTISFSFNNAGIYTGAVPPLAGGKSVNDVWATLSFTDTGGLGQEVTMTMKVMTGIFADEANTFVNDWWFNGTAAATSSNYSYVSGIEVFKVELDQDGATGAGTGMKFDGLFNFKTNTKDLSAGEESVYKFTNLAGLSIADFNLKSVVTGENVARYAAVHVQGFNGLSGKSGACIPGSTEVPCLPPEPPCDPRTDPNQCDGGGGEQEVPEPATLAILGLGLGAMAYVRRRRYA